MTSSKVVQNSHSPVKGRKKCLIMSQSTAGAHLEEVDDAEERTNRNRLRLVEEANQFHSSPATPERRKSIVSNAGMTNAQIAEHYSNCLKLSAENRINLKNAFDLHLIDLMSSIVLTKDDPNFQTASSTIDAGAKIYAYRVDNLHRETYRVCSDLGKGSKATEDADDDSQDQEEWAQSKQQVQAPTTVKKKRKLARGSCIETNEKALNLVCNEAKFQTDELFESVRASFEEGNALGLFLNTLTTLDDGNGLVLHSMCPVPSTSKARSVDDLQPCQFTTELPSDCPGVYNGHICSDLVDFTFSWTADNIKSFDETFGAKLETPTKKSEFAAAEPMHHDSFDHLNGPEDNEADNDLMNDSIRMENELSDQKKDKKLKSLEAAISCQDLEYSYFDANALQSFLGPNHWKMSMKTRKIASTLSDQKDAISGTRKKPLQRKPRKQVHSAKKERIDFNEKINFKNLLVPAKAEKTMLTEASLNKYQMDDHTFETEAASEKQYDFNALFLKPNFRLQKVCHSPSQRLEGGQVGGADSDDSVELGAPNASMTDNNFNERDDDDEQGAPDGTPSRPSSGGMPENPLGNGVVDTDLTLIQQPGKINKIDINYAKHAKRIDVKKVKTAIWSILSGESLDTTYTSPNKSHHVMNNLKPNLFSNVLHELPKILPEQAMKNLTTHTAFTLLLHMCNDKNLELVPNKESSDLEIKSGD